MNETFKSAWVIITAMTVCLSCHVHKSGVGDHPVLQVSLEENPLSLFDLFKEVEIIPLASTGESLFAYTDNIEVFHDTIFIYDRTSYALYIFGPEGQFVNKIRKVGRGPGEYPFASDFAVNPQNRTVHILNPMGIISEYDFNGRFIHEVRLPKPPANYRFLELLDSDTFLTWSSVYGKNNAAVHVFDRVTNEMRDSCFACSNLWSSFRYGSFFNKYRNAVYYHESLSNQVYRITADTCRIAYEWDTGIRLIDSERLAVPENEITASIEELFADYKNGTIPFFFGPQFQTGKYYYALLTFSQPKPVRKSLFYDRSTGESRLFAKTREGIALDLKYMTDDYAMGLIEYEDKDLLKKLVSEENALLLERMKEDDNPWIVKYILK